MIYFENLNYEECSDVYALKCICIDKHEQIYWRISPPPSSKICGDLLSVDTFDEAHVWCDLHNLKIVKIMDQIEFHNEINSFLCAQRQNKGI